MRIAAELHDVGKVAIPDEILLKPGPLDAGEWRFMERHTLIGERIIGSSPGLAPVAAMVRSSHERWDGRGYPDRLSGEDIPLGARIVAVCDAYDAMTKDRSYRSGMDPELALTELRRCAGSQFDPAVVVRLRDGGAGARGRRPARRLMPAPDAFQPTWLCRTPRERARMLDMERRLAPVRHLCFAAIAVALVASGAWVGWWTLAPLALAAIGFVVLGRGLEEAAQPEYRLALAWMLSQALIAASIALTGGPDSPALPWLAIPTVTLPARFGVRGVLAGSGVTIGILLLVTVGIDAPAVLADPVPTLMTLTLIVSITALSVALMRSDLEHRSEAAIDQLTGMLNRGALDTRVAELEAQARRTPQPVALIIADLDRFKAINDERGHAVGDAVLAEVAERVRGELRAYDLAYRLGGEEFLVVLPGACEREAAELGGGAAALRGDRPDPRGRRHRLGRRRRVGRVRGLRLPRAVRPHRPRAVPREAGRSRPRRPRGRGRGRAAGRRAARRLISRRAGPPGSACRAARGPATPRPAGSRRRRCARRGG